MTTAEIQDYLNFKTKVYDLTFGKDAINKKYTDSQVYEIIKEHMEKSFLFDKMQQALQEEGWDINRGESL